ncbi:hypothetical protein SLA2020_244830 [Shorea laevis]
MSKPPLLAALSLVLAGMDKGRGLEEKGEGEEGVEGVGGFEEESKPKWVLAVTTVACIRASGPKAKRIISFSPWSCISKYPMIFEAFSGSKLWILEYTILVASYESMEPNQYKFPY